MKTADALVFLLLSALTEGTFAVQPDRTISIDKPLTILEAGHYVVTQDFTATNETAIEIKTDNVAIDLGGHTITSIGSGTCLPATITIDNSVGGRGIEISNGKIVKSVVGGDECPAIINPFRPPLRGMEIRIHDIDANAGIGFFGVKSAEVLRCRVHDTLGFGIILDGNGYGTFTGLIADNVVNNVRFVGLGLVDLRGGIVRGNIVSNTSLAEWAMALIENLIGESGSNIVNGNVVVGTSGGGAGILVNSNYNDVRENVFSKNSNDGIQSNIGHGNHFEDNRIQSNGGCGLGVPRANNNSFRNNIGGANGRVGVGCIATGNFDLGGNFGL